MSADKIRRVDLELRATSGPTGVSFRLFQPGPATVGRRSSNTLQLNDPAVSRDHTEFSFRPAPGRGDPTEGDWLLEDMGSTHGTWLNGVRLKGNRRYHVRAGDLMVIGPWTLLVVDRSGPSKPETTLATVNDVGVVGTVVSPFEPSTEQEISPQRLQLLQECSERIYVARTEAAVVEAVLDAAVAGTDFTRVVFLRPMTEEDRVDVVASRGDDPTMKASRQLSRALVREAASGSPARLQHGSSGKPGAPGQVEPEDVVALCVPIMVASTLVGFIYLDSPAHDLWRSSRPASKPVPQRVDAGAFPIALARLGAMGMANLMRADIEQRQARMEAKLQAAAEAQRWLSPQRQGQSGPFAYVGETRQGRYIGGDFFDIIPLRNERLGVVLGNVGGRGIPVSVLVGASQGYLHACLLEHGDPALAVASINRFYHSRILRPGSLEVWVGVFDARKRALTYVVAGSGWAMTAFPDGRCESLAAGQNLPVGTEANVEYQTQTVALVPGVRTLILSTGFVEQRARDLVDEQGDDSPSSDADDQPQRFGIDRARECLQSARAGEDEIAALFSALEQYAGTAALDDDATAVMIRW